MKHTKSTIIAAIMFSLILLIISMQNTLASQNPPSNVKNQIEINEEFLSLTSSKNINPDKFVFIDKTNAALGTLITSNEIAVTGIDSLSPISIEGGEYSINGGPYTNDVNLVSNGDLVVVKIKSPSDFSAQASATLKIGAVSDEFSVTTISIDMINYRFHFFALSNLIK